MREHLNNVHGNDSQPMRRLAPVLLVVGCAAGPEPAAGSEPEQPDRGTLTERQEYLVADVWDLALACAVAAQTREVQAKIALDYESAHQLQIEGETWDRKAEALLTLLGPRTDALDMAEAVVEDRARDRWAKWYSGMSEQERANIHSFCRQGSPLSTFELLTSMERRLFQAGRSLSASATPTANRTARTTRQQANPDPEAEDA